MSTSFNTQSIAAIGAAAFIAGLAIFFTPVAQGTAVAAPVTDATPQPSVKGDQLPLNVKGAACSSRGWPHYEQGCQFDLRRPADEAQAVRVIVLR